jgi:hypothetical protein
MSNFVVKEESSILAAYIEKALSGGLHRENSKIRFFRRTLQVGGIVIIACSRIGMVMICMKGAAIILDRPIDDPVSLTIGISNAVGTLVTFGFVAIFSTLNLIEEITRPLVFEEKLLTMHIMPVGKRTLIKIIAIIVGLLAQLPMAFATYTSALYVPIFFFIMQLLDCGRASYSTFMSLIGMTKTRVTGSLGIDKDLQRIRNNLIKKINHFRNSLIGNAQERKLFFDQIDFFMSGSIANEDACSNKKGHDSDHNENYSRYLTTLLNFSERELDSNVTNPLSNGMRYVIDFFILLMGMAVIAEFWQLAGAGIAFVSSVKLTAIIASIFVALANSYLWFSLIRRSTYFTVNFFRGISSPSVTKEFMPRFYRIFSQLGTIFSVFTFVPSVLFAKNYFPHWAYYPVAFLSSLGLIFAGISAVHSLRDIIIRGYIKRKGKNRLLDLDSKLQRLTEIIGKTNQREIASFLIYLPEALQKLFQSPSKEQLEAFLSQFDDHSTTYKRLDNQPIHAQNRFD